MAVRLSALCAGRPLPPGRFVVLISITDRIETRAIVRVRGLGKLKKKINNLIKYRSQKPEGRLLACSIFFLNSPSGGWSPTGSTRHGGHWLAYCSLPRVIMMMENLVEWRLTVETEVLGENQPQRHFVHHKSHLTRTGIEPGPPRWEGSD
jgi:hypothetical protein